MFHHDARSTPQKRGNRGRTAPRSSPPLANISSLDVIFFCSAVTFFFLLCNFFLLAFCSIQSHSGLSLQSCAGGACGQLSAGTAEGGGATSGGGEGWGGGAGPANRKSRSSSSPRSCHSCTTQATQMHFYGVDDEECAVNKGLNMVVYQVQQLHWGPG